MNAVLYCGQKFCGMNVQNWVNECMYNCNTFIYTCHDIPLKVLQHACHAIYINTNATT